MFTSDELTRKHSTHGTRASVRRVSSPPELALSRYHVRLVKQHDHSDAQGRHTVWHSVGTTILNVLTPPTRYGADVWDPEIPHSVEIVDNNDDRVVSEFALDGKAPVEVIEPIYSALHEVDIATFKSQFIDATPAGWTRIL